MIRLKVSDRIARALPIALTDRLCVTVDSRLRAVRGAAGSASWMLRRVILAISFSDEIVLTIPLFPLPGRLLVELPTEFIFDNWAGRVSVPGKE